MVDRQIRSTITHLHRLHNSASGNPRYRVSLGNGEVYQTRWDSYINYSIGNSDYRDTEVLFTIDVKGYIIAARPVEQRFDVR